SSDGMADYVEFGLEPANATGKAVALQTEEGTEAEADVVALGPGTACLAAFHPAELLDPTVILLDPPGGIGVLQPRQSVQFPVAGRPVRRVPVSGDHPEDSNRPITR